MKIITLSIIAVLCASFSIFSQCSLDNGNYIVKYDTKYNQTYQGFELNINNSLATAKFKKGIIKYDFKQISKTKFKLIGKKTKNSFAVEQQKLKTLGEPFYKITSCSLDTISFIYVVSPHILISSGIMIRKEKSVSLFDGKSFDKWQQYGSDEIGSGWSIENGMIVSSKEDTEDNNLGLGPSLLTKEKFGNFELVLDYKLSPKGNSGILFHIKQDSIYKHDYETGTEYQIIDDTVSDSLSISSRKTAANYDMFAAKSDKKLNAPNKWNRVKIVYYNEHVEHWLNGEKVLEYNEGSKDYKKRYKNSKWVNFPGWGKYKEGHIGLQNHGDEVWFKNIRIRRLE